MAPRAARDRRDGEAEIDPITGQATEEAPTTLDFLGKRSPIFSTGKPALPTGAAPAPSVAPSGPSGLGKPPTPTLAAHDVPSGLTEGFDFASLFGGGDPGSEGPGGPSVGGPGSFPQSFDLASINLGSVFGKDETGPFSGVGARIGPTGTISPTTGNRGLDNAIQLGAQLAGVPASAPVFGLMASIFGGPVLGPLAGIAGVAGLPLTFVAIAHAIASNVDGTIASNIHSVMSDPQLTPEMQAAFLAEIAQGFPMSGGVQGVQGVPGSLQGPQGAAFGTGGSTGPPGRADSLADMWSGGLFGQTGRTDVASPPAAPADAPDGTGTGAGPGAGQGGPTGSDVGEGGGSASEG